MSNLIEFKTKKYWDKFVDLKKVSQEFTKNEKNKKKFYALKKAKKEDSYDFKILKSEIIW